MRTQLLDALAAAGNLNDRLWHPRHPQVWRGVDRAVSAGIRRLDASPRWMAGWRQLVAARTFDEAVRTYVIGPNNWRLIFDELPSGGHELRAYAGRYLIAIKRFG